MSSHYRDHMLAPRKGAVVTPEIESRARCLMALEACRRGMLHIREIANSSESEAVQKERVTDEAVQLVTNLTRILHSDLDRFSSDITALAFHLGISMQSYDSSKVPVA